MSTIIISKNVIFLKKNIGIPIYMYVQVYITIFLCYNSLG